MGTKTFLQYTNMLLGRLNEVQLTSSNFASATGFQLTAQEYINAAIKDIHNAEREWPFNYISGSQVLVPGVQTYALPNSGDVSVNWDTFYLQTQDLVTNQLYNATNLSGWTDNSSGAGASTAFASITRNNETSGAIQLTKGSGTASIYTSFPVTAGKNYRVKTRIFGDSVYAQVGSTLGGNDLYAGTTLKYQYVDAGQFYEFTFFGGSSTGLAYLQYEYSATITTFGSAVAYVANSNCFEDIPPRKLPFCDLIEWQELYEPNEKRQSATAYPMPQRVFPTNNLQFGVSPIPDRPYKVTFDYWQFPGELSAYTDTTTVPDKYDKVVLFRAMQYAYEFRDNVESGGQAKEKFEKGLQTMRTDLINREERMRGKQYFAK